MNTSHILTALSGLVEFFTAISIITGIYFVVAGLVRLAQSAIDHSYRPAQGVARIMAGVFLLSLSRLIAMATNSALGSSTSLNFLAYQPPASGSSADVVRVGVIAVMILGYFAVIWSLWTLGWAWDNRHELGPVFTRFAGGILLINIIPVLNMLGYTLGGTMQSSITRIFG